MFCCAFILSNSVLEQARLSRFTGANAISSADYYDNGEGGPRRPATSSNSALGDISTSELMSRLSVQVSHTPCCVHCSPITLLRCAASP